MSQEPKQTDGPDEPVKLPEPTEGKSPPRWAKLSNLRLSTQLLLAWFLNFTLIGTYYVSSYLPIFRFDMPEYMDSDGRRLCSLGLFQRNLTLDMTFAWIFVGLGILILICLLIGRALCGWACRIGLIQDLLTRSRDGLKGAAKEPPMEIHQRMTGIKFGILASVLLLSLAIGLAELGSEAARLTFISYLPEGTARLAPYCALCPAPMFYYLLDSTNMLNIFQTGDWDWRLTDPIAWGLIFVIIVFVAGALAIPRFWCRYLCPLGALTGCFNKVSLLQLRKEPGDCDNCDQCVVVCPTRQVEVATTRLGLASFSNCTFCGECVKACPRNALSLTLHNRTIYEGKN